MVDTHTFLWFITQDSRLPDHLRIFLERPETVPYLSAVSGLEISLKYKLGKMPLPDLPERYIVNMMVESGFEELPVSLAHAITAGSLPLIHKDPFDRLLVAQSQVEGIPLVTADNSILKYDVDVLW